MSKKCKIEIELSASYESLFLDGKETHMMQISDEAEFVNFTEETLVEYAWWVGEAWRPVLEEIENNSEEYETEVVIHL